VVKVDWRRTAPSAGGRWRGQAAGTAPRLRGHVVLDHPALRIVLLSLAQQPLEIADIAIDRGAEVSVAIVAAADLVECRLAVDENAMPITPMALDLTSPFLAQSGPIQSGA
jgi:hypothetical protein